jgi:hypothetical protein
MVRRAESATLDQLHVMLLTVREPNSATLTFLLFLWERGLAPGGKVIEMEHERRRGPRYLFLADTEVTDMISDAKGSARTSELSISGCFIDTRNLIRGTLHRQGQSFGSKSLKEIPRSLRLVV